MKINISFVDRAEPCSEKPNGCYEKINDNLYVALWSGWEVSISDTKVIDGESTWSLMVQHYITKPTQRQIRVLKKLMWSQL